MKIRTEFPRKVDEVEYLWIPLPDGTRLCARLWVPADAGADPVPADHRLHPLSPHRRHLRA